MDAMANKEHRLARAAVEIAFIVFLFYANLLMGDFTHTGEQHPHGFFWALHDVVTPENFTIALIAGIIGYGVFELLRKRLQ